MDQRACEAKGWFWIGGKCLEPKISGITMRLTRGKECGGNSKRRKVAKPQELSAAVKKALIKASVGGPSAK